MTFLQTESNGSLLSIGFVPEGAKTWGNGSYRYQANAKKTTFVGGSRRQNDYGSYYRAKNVIGCGWNREEKIIYFTKDGVDQGPAFTNVSLGKVLPAIGASKGVNVTVNFGQEPFLFKLVVEGETAEEREKRKKEEEEKRKKEQEIEREKRKKEKEDEKAANALAAQPLVSMGFDLKMSLVAMKQTGHAGLDAASNWLVENMNTWNFDEDSDKEDEKEEESAEAKEEEKTDEKEKPEKEPEKVEEKVEDNKNKEETYDIGSAQTFYLSDNFTYVDDGQSKDKEGSKVAR